MLKVIKECLLSIYTYFQKKAVMLSFQLTPKLNLHTNGDSG